MRNRYPGKCYRCREIVEIGHGHFERHLGQWRVQHWNCCIKAREKYDAEQAAYQTEMAPVWQEQRMKQLKLLSTMTGKKGKQARNILRKMGLLPPVDTQASAG